MITSYHTWVKSKSKFLGIPPPLWPELTSIDRLDGNFAIHTCMYEANNLIIGVNIIPDDFFEIAHSCM